MGTQLDMFSDDPIVVAFREYHKANPRIYELFERFVFELIAANRKRYSADAVIHRIRWHVNVETKSQDDFKINDHFSALYSRMFMDQHPEHRGFFETRTRRAA